MWTILTVSGLGICGFSGVDEFELANDVLANFFVVAVLALRHDLGVDIGGPANVSF